MNLKNPFPGLRPFDTHESLIFFGRDGLSDTLLAKLRAARFVAVVGTSGSGKSSLVRAGLLPALRGGFMPGAGSGWRIALFRPINNPVGNLAQALAEAGITPAGTEDSPDGPAIIEETLRRSSLGLIEAVRQSALSPHENLLIVVDQFEELYRFKPHESVKNPRDEAAAFVKVLLEATQQTALPIYVILTMRSDYLGESAQFWGLPEAINKGQFLIPRMDDDERREAIVGPVRVFGERISSPLVNRLLNDAGDSPHRLPILQHALMRTWDYWLENRRDSKALDIEHYEAVGGMDRALSLHADEAYNELTEAQKVVAEKLFKRLTDKGAGTREGRLPATVGEIVGITQASEADVLAVIEAFRKEGRSFLMPPPPKPLSADTLIDISHESLIQGWERLSVWVEEEADSKKLYERLLDDALNYPKGVGLLADPELQLALDWFDKRQPNQVWATRYSPEQAAGYFGRAIKYLNDSREKRDRDEALKEAARRKSLKYVSAVAVALSVLLAGAMALGFVANEARRRAVSERERADSALIKADKARAEADKDAALAREEHGKAIAALIEAESARQTAQEAERKAEEAEQVALNKAQEAETQRAAAVAAQAKVAAQANRGNFLEGGISAMLDGKTTDAVNNFRKVEGIYQRSGDGTKEALTDILIGSTILKSQEDFGGEDNSLDSSDALKEFNEALRMSKEKKAVLSTSAFINIGDRIVASDVDNVEAVPYYERAAELTNDPELKVTALVKLADIYEMEKAVPTYERALNLLDKSSPKLPDIYMKLGDRYLKKNSPGDSTKRDLVAAEKAYNDALNTAEAVKNGLVRGDVYRDLAVLYRFKGDDDKLMQSYVNAGAAYRAVTDPKQIGQALLKSGMTNENIGRIFESRKQPGEAIKAYEEAVSLYAQAVARGESKANLYHIRASNYLSSLKKASGSAP